MEARGQPQKKLKNVCYKIDGALGPNICEFIIDESQKTIFWWGIEPRLTKKVRRVGLD